MKLVAVFLFAATLHASASIKGQNITLIQKNRSLQDVFFEIRKQTGYNFLYKDALLQRSRPVTISVTNMPVVQVLDLIFKNQPLTYSVIDNTIIIKEGQKNIDVYIKVVGKIIDADGNPLAGVSILEKGTTNGTASGEDGGFSLNVTSDNAVLIFSSLGYLPKEVRASNNMTVVLEKTDAELDQVVIVGYGVQKKINLTGAVSTVDFDKQSMNTRAISNVSSALAGLASGLSVRQSNGLPKDNNDADLSIRGVGSLNVSSAPLVLVDGQVASIGSVNPNDVASVSILKDAASAAIYGSRASNGVILITTKTGKGANGKVTFSYNGYMGSKTPTLLPDFVYYTPDHMRLNNMALINNAGAATAAWYTKEQIEEWETGVKTDPLKYPSTNWWDAIIKKNIIHSHNISARGGTDKLNFYSSLDYYKDDGLLYNSGFSRFSFRNNLNYKVNNWLKLGSNISYTPSVSEPVDINDAFSNFRSASPSMVAQAPDGRFGAPQLTKESDLNNVLYSIMSQRGETKSNRLQGKIFGVVEPLKGLAVTASYFTDIVQNHGWNGVQPDNLWNFATDQIIRNNASNPLTLSNSFSKNERHIVDLYADYIKSFGRHNGHLLAGYNQEYFKSTGFSGTRQNLLSYETPVLNAATGEITALTGTAADNALRSFFGRFNYDFDNKYLFEVNLRYDGSSKFSPDTRWGAFPSASVGWVISRENFFTPLRHVVNSLKLRASYGELGNNGIGNYDWQNFYSIVKYPFNRAATSGLVYTAFGNNKITWESTLASNFGIDARLFNSLDLTINYYDKLTKNILAGLPIPATNGGINAPKVNSAEVRNSGIDLDVRYAKQLGKLGIAASFNLAYNKNRIVKYKGDFIEPQGANAGAWTEGYPIGVFWVREVDHIIQTQQEVDDLVAQGYTFSPSKPGPGDFLYKNNNGDKIINDGDRILKGNPIPLYTYGGSLTLTYEGVDCSVYFDGVGKWDRYLQSATYSLAHNTGAWIWPTAYLNMWTPENTNTNIPKVYTSNAVNNQQSDYFLHKADYFKIRSLQLGYSLPTSVLRYVKFTKFRVFGNLENYFTWTKWPNMDPEMTRSTNDDLSYPLGRVASVGVQIGF